MENKTVEIRYFIYQLRNGGQIRYISYSTYNGSFEQRQQLSDATPFTDKETAVDLTKLLNAQNNLLKGKFDEDYTYHVIEEVITRKVLDEDGEYIEEEEVEE